MSNPLTPPIRPSLGSTFKRPVNELIVGNPPVNPGIEITVEIPPELLAKYPTATAAIIMQSDSDHYSYMIVMPTDFAQGTVQFAFVQETMTYNYMSNGDWNFDGINLVINLTDSMIINSCTLKIGNGIAPANLHISNLSTLQIDAGATVDVNATPTFNAGGNDGNSHDLAFYDVTTTPPISFTTNTSNISTQNFANPFTTPPRAVIPIIQGAAGSTSGWTAKTDSYTTTSCRLILTGPSAAWSNVTVLLVAIQ